ncbi:MAG: hypothetical protein ACLRV0_01935 [Anaerobutyricum soehngenii]
MSSYYAGYYGIGCVLSVEEFKNFLTSYFTKHPDLTEEEQEEVRIEEYAFKRSNENGIFHIVEDTLEFIRHPKYHDYEDILKEFKGKLESYLPEKFPWDERIGNYSYAYYA